MARVKIGVGVALASTIGLVTTVALAAASVVTNATILSVRVDPVNGQTVVTLDKADPNRPTCSTFNSGRSFQIPLNTDAGREASRVAMAAFLAGKKVDVTGTAGSQPTACPAPQNNKELLAIIEVHQ
jgi:hypothetical protein